MSKDLRVVTTRQPEVAAVSDFLSKRRGQYVVEGHFQAGSGCITISRQGRGDPLPIFTLDGPFRIETEDVDDPLIAFVLAPQWLTEINVPMASAQAEFMLARSLGTHLAKSYQGAIYDPQDDIVLWPKHRPALYKTPQAAEAIDVVTLRWYLPYSRRGSQTAKTFVEIAQRYLYECLPRRYGLFEPLQGKVTDGDFAGFYSLWDRAVSSPHGDTLHFSCAAPCFGGSASFSDPRDEMPRNAGAQKIVKLHVNIDGRAMEERSWHKAAVSLFKRVSRGLGSFYAIGYVERGIEAKGRNLYFTGGSECYPLPRHNRWLGIPAVPTWLTWYGPPYSEAVYSACEDHITERYDEGYLIMKTTEPSDIDSLAPDFPVVPKQLQAKLSQQTLSRHLASIFGPDVLPSDDRMMDRPADVVLPLE